MDAFCTRNDESHDLILGRLDKANAGAEHRQGQINELILWQTAVDTAARVRQEMKTQYDKKLLAVLIALASAATSILTAAAEKFL